MGCHDLPGSSFAVEPSSGGSLASYGVTAAELEEGGIGAAGWPDIEREHLERIESTLEVLTVR